MSKHESQLIDEPDAPLERVEKQPLPEHVLPLIDSYEEIVDDRDRFLWKWAHSLFPKFTLSCVDPGRVEEVQDAKLVALLFVSILDDVAEKHQDLTTFEEATKIPFDHRSVNLERDGVDSDVLILASDVWNQLAPTINEGPRSGEFEDIVRFDLKQVLNAMEYSYVANQHLEMISEYELRTYDAHNMMLFGFADMDLVHSPVFDQSDLAVLRRVITRAQRMVRIGNWITTWERELIEGDFTSGVVAHALEHDIVSVDDLRASQEETSDTDVETLVGTIQDHNVEDVFLNLWHQELATGRELEDEIASVDVGTYLDGIETVMEYHLASRGLK